MIAFFTRALRANLAPTGSNPAGAAVAQEEGSRHDFVINVAMSTRKGKIIVEDSLRLCLHF
jgi:hypothetical protein